MSLLAWWEKVCPKCPGTMVMGGTVGESWYCCRACGYRETKA